MAVVGDEQLAATVALLLAAGEVMVVVFAAMAELKPPKTKAWPIQNMSRILFLMTVSLTK